MEHLFNNSIQFIFIISIFTLVLLLLLLNLAYLYYRKFTKRLENLEKILITLQAKNSSHDNEKQIQPDSVIDFENRFNANLESARSEIESIKKDISHLATLIKSASTNTYVHPDNAKMAQIDYFKNLEDYLRINFPNNSKLILNLLESLASSISNFEALRNLVIDVCMKTNFNSMSDTKRIDLCRIASDYLSKYGIAIISPKIGQEYDEKTMIISKQFSPSQRVSGVITFSVFSNRDIILKADVNVG